MIENGKYIPKEVSVLPTSFSGVILLPIIALTKMSA
jgi:hypothetical protein